MNNNQNSANANIVPQLGRRYFYSVQRSFINAIRNHIDSVCRSHIGEEYIHYALNTFKDGILYYDEDEEIVGLALWKTSTHMSKSTFEKSKSMHIYLVCGLPGDYKFGNIFFPDMTKYCIDYGINTITLEALNDKLISYYESYDFQLTPEYGKPKLMTKIVEMPTIGCSRGNKTRRHKRKHNLSSNGRLPSTQQSDIYRSVCVAASTDLGEAGESPSIR